MQRRAFVLLNRVVNAVVVRSGIRRFRGGALLHLTTTGRRTGQQRTTPLAYLPDGDGWVVVASNGGADWEPAWWLNLRAGGPATVRVDGTTTAVTGTEVEGPERERLWTLLNERVVDYTGYQAGVRRRLAVVRLAPRASSPA